MDFDEFDFYLKTGVKKFCLKFDFSYHKKLFQAHLVQKGYKIFPVDEPEELKVLIQKKPLFNQPFYWIPYDSGLWNWLGKNTLAVPVILEGLTGKTAELFEGPSEAQLIAQAQKKLTEKLCSFTPDGWKALLDSFRDKEGKISDFEGLYNLGYSLGLQFDVINSTTVQQFTGFKAQLHDLFNMLAIKNKQRVLQAMYILVTDEEAITLCRGLQVLLNQVLEVSASIKSKVSSDDYAVKKKIHAFRAKKLYEQSKLMGENYQTQLLVFLNRLDMELKSTRVLSKTEIFKNSVILFLDSL